MKSIHWTTHALDALSDRALELDLAEATLRDPQRIVTGHGGRTLFLRKYYDVEFEQEMVICVVTQIAEERIVAITAYKTSKVQKYFPETAR